MAKITLPTIASGFASNTAFNTAFDAIEAELQNKVLYRNNTSGETNTMSNVLDMNSNAITNASSVTTTALVVAGTDLTGSVTASAASAAAAATSAGAASTSATAAATSATTAAAAAAGIKWKEPVFGATTANITLSGTQTIDGLSITAEKRVLVKNQTAQENNGIYVCKASTWERADKANTFVELPSAAVVVQQGSINKDQIFICITDVGGTLGGSATADEIDWSPFGIVTATATSGLSVSGSAITLAPTLATGAAFNTDRSGNDVLVYGDVSDSNNLKKGTLTELAAGMPITTVAGGGTGVGTLTDGGILLGSGTGAITPMAALGAGVIVIGDGTTDPSTESLVDTARTWTAAQRGEITALTSATTVTIDMAVSNNFSCTMGHNIAFANPSNDTAGQSGSIFLTQDGTGSRTASFGTDWEFAGASAPTLSTAGGSVDRIDYIIMSSTKIQAVATLALA